MPPYTSVFTDACHGPRQLIQQVSECLKTEFCAPTDEGRSEPRYMISHVITTRMADGRGGLSPNEDVPETPELEPEHVIEEIDVSCCPENWAVTTAHQGNVASAQPVTQAPTNGPSVTDMLPQNLNITDDLMPVYIKALFKSRSEDYRTRQECEVRMKPRSSSSAPIQGHFLYWLGI